jgi:stearoyl-CoA desaturase (Delta-9 desaturase)
MSKPQHITKNKGGMVDEDPADLHIPDDYVDYALRNSKPLPPITWKNWWKELNYLSVAILTLSPAIAIYGAQTTKLRWQTAAFATFYYFFTGLGSYLTTT